MTMTSSIGRDRFEGDETEALKRFSVAFSLPRSLRPVAAATLVASSARHAATCASSARAAAQQGHARRNENGPEDDVGVLESLLW